MKFKIAIVVFILSLSSITTKAQNLVYNGYFELYTTCPPNGLSQFTHTTGWFISGGSPDYWNVCSNGRYNTMGYQQDCCGGGGYAGEYMMVSINTPGDDIGREYMGTKLIDTLKAGHKYLASMYVNRSNNWNYSIASIGMLFTDTAIVLSSQQVNFFTSSPQVKNIVSLTDTTHWILVQDTIIAVGNEAYLTIGNFNPTVTSDTVSYSGTWAAYGSAYYYIDGVSVYDLATMGIEQLAVNNEQLNIYPNPNNGNMVVEYKITEDAVMQIIDLSGNLVETYSLLATGNRIEVKNQNLQNGVYLYRIISNNAVVKFGKVVIMK